MTSPLKRHADTTRDQAEDTQRQLANEHSNRFRVAGDLIAIPRYEHLGLPREGAIQSIHVDALEMNMIIQLGKVTEETQSWGPVETLDSLSIMAKMGT